ncbi:MAG TPA: hypothetical protein VMZ30_02480 [Pyrinomonadaceae bacterium]|nr:hypothetical protein [Pyrinomonadaceae bacterium]
MRKKRANNTVALLLKPDVRPADRAQLNCGYRWATWADGLRNRHARIPIRYHAMTLVLARIQSSHSYVERWQSTYLKQLPTIRLSIGPILLRFSDTTIRSLRAPLAVTTETAGRITREFVYNTPPHSQQLLFNQHQPLIPNTDVSFKTSAAELRDRLFQSPLLRVFERQATAGSALPHFEARVLKRGLQLIDRVLIGRERVEETVRRILVSREQRASGSAATKIPENKLFESPHSLRTAPAGPDYSGGQIDLERLTEQVVRNIDSRIIAHRERTGRVF